MKEVKGLFFSNDLSNPAVTYQAASYTRLSRDDPDKSESDSIINQKQLIRDFVESHPSLQLVDEYSDDGYSGVNFERPDFARMIADIKADRINCVIVKDLSRFGRNYIEVGRYLEQFFPFMRVRFIAINDNLDTGQASSESEQFILPFKNLFNDNYCRDISIKIRSQLALKRKNGEFLSAYAHYGYIKDPDNHNRLVIDPEAAEVVCSIFAWRIQGMSAQRIADRLNEMGILCPMEYKIRQGQKVSTLFRTKNKAQWSAQSIGRILKNEIYIGVTTQGRTTTPNYKVKSLVEKPPEEWARVENTHDPIIHPDVFESVQTLLQRDTRIAPGNGSTYLFSGFLICADCKYNMIRRSGRKYDDHVVSYYQCAGHKKKNGCPSSHIIREDAVYDAVLSAIRQQYFLVMDMERLLKYARELPDNPNSLHRFEVQLAHLETDINYNLEMKLKLVENLNQGILTREDFVEMSAMYDKKIRASRLAHQKVKEERDNLDHLPEEDEWLTSFKKCQNIYHLDRLLLAELIDRIEVYEDKRIKVFFKFQDQVDRVQKYLTARGLMPQAVPSDTNKPSAAISTAENNDKGDTNHD